MMEEVEENIHSRKDFNKDEPTSYPGPHSEKNEFQWNIWLLLLINNWIFGYGGNIVSWREEQIVGSPRRSDVLMLIQSIINVFCISRLFHRSQRSVFPIAVYTCLGTCILGSFVILVGNMFRKSLHCFECSSYFEDNNNYKDQVIVSSFLCHYEIIGRIFRFTPFYILMLLYTVKSHNSNEVSSSYKDNLVFWYYIMFTGFYFWHQVTFEEIYLEFIMTYLLMCIFWKRKRRHECSPDINSVFVFFTFNFTFFCLICYCIWLIYRGARVSLYVYILFNDYRRLSCN